MAQRNVSELLAGAVVLAAAIGFLGYAVAHAASADGDVPYGQWPEGVKNHFITRTPPDGFVVG